MKPTDEIQEWPACSLQHRLHMCRRLLFVHGFLTDYHNVQIKKRMQEGAHEPGHQERSPGNTPEMHEPG